MRIQLILQSLILVQDVLGLQLLVFYNDFLLAPDKVGYITTSRYGTGSYKITQRMQLMMYHGINGRNIESVMQEYKTFP